MISLVMGLLLLLVFATSVLMALVTGEWRWLIVSVGCYLILQGSTPRES